MPGGFKSAASTGAPAGMTMASHPAWEIESGTIVEMACSWTARSHLLYKERSLVFCNLESNIISL